MKGESERCKRTNRVQGKYEGDCEHQRYFLIFQLRFVTHVDICSHVTYFQIFHFVM